MSEIEAMHYCPNCKKETECMFGGSGRNGYCMECSKALNPNESCDLKRVICQSVVDEGYENEECDEN